MMYRDVVFTIIVFLCLAGNEFFQCSVDLTKNLLCTMFSSRDSLAVVKVSNAGLVNWRASRATSGAAYYVEVRISGGDSRVVVDQVGTWQPAFRWILVCGFFRDVIVSCR